MGPRSAVLGGVWGGRMRTVGRRWGGVEETSAGHCLFKTRTQHHRMVGKNYARAPAYRKPYVSNN
eukprot:6824575-Pyramimonas_sp.AAC.1